MLAHILALAVGFASFSLYMSAFFFPEVHRKYDFTWSGVGMFYALVLWVCAGRITGGVLLGQTASVALLGWLGWQTLSLRRSLTPIAQQTPLPNSAKTVGEAVQLKLQELQTRWQQQTQNSPVGTWLTTAQEWAQVLIDSVAKPKKPRRQPPSELRQSVRSQSARRSPVSAVSQPPQPPQSDPLEAAVETELETELEEATEAVEELITQSGTEAEVDTAAAASLGEAEATGVDRSRQVEPQAATADRPPISVSAETFDDFDNFEADDLDDQERETLQSAAQRDRTVAKKQSASRSQQGWLGGLRDRVQGILNPSAQRQRKPPIVRPAPSLDELADALDEDIPESEIMVAVLEESISDDATEVAVVEVVEVVSEDGETIAVTEAIEVEIIEPAAEQDAPAAFANQEVEPPPVTVADAAIEAEIAWEANAASDPLSETSASESDAAEHQPDPAIGTTAWTDDTPIDTEGDGITVNEPSGEPTENQSTEDQISAQ